MFLKFKLLSIVVPRLHTHTHKHAGMRARKPFLFILPWSYLYTHHIQVLLATIDPGLRILLGPVICSWLANR